MSNWDGKTQLREVDGITFDMRPDGTMKQRFQKIVFRITKDEVGKSISLCDEIRGIMLEIPLEPVEDLFLGGMRMSILMSIKPEWCKKIIYGEKTIEVRKTKPVLTAMPFTVYVYATFDGENWAVYGKQKSGFVIGAFTCERVERYDIPYPAYQKEMDQELKEKSGLTYMQLYRYAHQQEYVYGWHISDFENWDTPLDISEFINSNGNIFKRPPQSWAYAARL